jgi:triacylglycerol lipase
MHHGFLGGGMKLGPWRWKPFGGMAPTLRARGLNVFATEVHPTAGIERRAGQLRQWILDHRGELGDQPFVLVANSMGGLDARFMISRMDMAQHVKALVTICTPHRGSPWADWCVANLGRRLGILRLIEETGLDIQAAYDLTVENCAKFNEQTVDAPNVQYFSISASQTWDRMPFFGIASFRVIQKIEGANDGQVSIKSAQWGKHLATWPLNHWEASNRYHTLRSHFQKKPDVPGMYYELIQKIVAELNSNH